MCVCFTCVYFASILPRPHTYTHTHTRVQAREYEVALVTLKREKGDLLDDVELLEEKLSGV
jgi:hypothetical protein